SANMSKPNYYLLVFGREADTRVWRRRVPHGARCSSRSRSLSSWTPSRATYRLCLAATGWKPVLRTDAWMASKHKMASCQLGRKGQFHPWKNTGRRALSERPKNFDASRPLSREVNV